MLIKLYTSQKEKGKDVRGGAEYSDMYKFLSEILFSDQQELWFVVRRCGAAESL